MGISRTMRFTSRQSCSDRPVLKQDRPHKHIGDRREPLGVWRLLGPGGWSTVKVTGPLASNHSDVVLRWAHDGHGIVMVGQSYVARALAQGTLVRVLPAWEQPPDVWAMSAARAAQSAKVRVCIDFLKQHLAEGKFALWKP